MYPIKQATTTPIQVFMADSNGDPVTGLTDGDFSVKRISKNGASFEAWGASLAEAELGFYSTEISATDSATNGILTMILQATGTIQQNLQFRISTRLPDNLAFPTTSGRPIDVNSAGHVGLDFNETSGSLVKDSHITGFNDPAASSIADAVWDEAMADHVGSTTFGDLGVDLAAVLEDTGSLQADWVDGGRLDVILDGIVTAIAGLNDFDPSSDEVLLSATAVDSILDEQIGDSTLTFRQALRIFVATLAGKSTGGGTTANNFRNVADSKNVVAATVDADGNRSSVVLSP